MPASLGVPGNPTAADGLPLPGGLVAVLDEAGSEVGGGVFYLLTSVVLVEPAEVRSDLAALVADRKRAFHWIREGPQMRQAILEIVCDKAALVLVRARACSRRAQVATRRDLLADLALDLAAEGIDHLVIESQGPRADGRDRAVLLDSLQASGGIPFSYDWRSKAEPLLWLPDAVGGACREMIEGRSQRWHDKLAGHVLRHGIEYA